MHRAAATLILLLTPLAAHAEEPAPKVTFDDHVKPIFREHCLTCHNANDKKGDLALDTFGNTMAGGGSGAVVEPGDTDSSRLWALVAHEDEPKMPPKADKLADAKLEIIKTWIKSGALENSGSVAKPKKQPTIDLGSSAGAAKPSGPVAMPEGLPRQPVIYTQRAGAVTALAASPWAPLVAIAGQKQIVLYHGESFQMLGVLPFPEGLPHVLKFSRSGSLLIAGGGRGASLGKVVVFDVKTGKRVIEVGDELDVVLAADINNAHTQVALAGPGKLIRVYSLADGSLVHEIKKHTDWVYALEYSPDGVLLATADRSNGLLVWEAETAREYQNLQGHTGPITDLSWRGDSNVLATGSLDGTIRLWEMENGKEIKKWDAHGGGVEAIDFTHDGRLASTGRDRTTKTWDANGGAIKSMPALGEFGTEVAFALEGKRVIAGDLSGAVRVWDAAEAKELAALAPNPPTLEMRVSEIAAQVAVADTAFATAKSELAQAQAALGGISSQAADEARANREAAQRDLPEKQTAHELAPSEATAAALIGAEKLIAQREAEWLVAGNAYSAARVAADKVVAEKQAAEQAAIAALQAKQTEQAAIAAEIESLKTVAK